MCHAAEFLAANTVAIVPASGAWVDSSIGFADGSPTYAGVPMTGRGTQYGCSNWTSTVLYPSGGVGYDVSPYCASVRPIACCNGSSRTRHRGFTTATTTGAILNGRSVARALTRCACRHSPAATSVTPPNTCEPLAHRAALIRRVDRQQRQRRRLVDLRRQSDIGRGQQYNCSNWTSGASTVLYAAASATT